MSGTAVFFTYLVHYEKMTNFFIDLACRVNVMAYLETTYPILKDGRDKMYIEARRNMALTFLADFLLLVSSFAWL